MNVKKPLHPLFAVLSVGFMVAAVVLPSSAPAEENEDLKAPGRCTAERHKQLQDVVEKFCNRPGKPPVVTRCESILETFEQLAAKEQAWYTCAFAREAINNECFSGGNKGHRQAVNDAKGAAKRCRDKIEEKEDLLRNPKCK
jgi:putative RNase toxin 16 of polymorphic toxin system